MSTLTNNFHLEVLPEEGRRVLRLLADLPGIEDFYLAGGTALALYLGHRISGDLDFFSEINFDETILIQKLSRLGKLSLEKKSEQTITGVLDGVKVSFIGYNYPLLAAFKNLNGAKIADISDIACMKIDAIASRGTKRDFVDIYFIVKEGRSLQEILDLFKEKYASLGYNMVHVAKSLVYFEDAENDAMPRMLASVSWEDVKQFFQKEIKRLEE